jgi:predicted transcriptional regulator
MYDILSLASTQAVTKTNVVYRCNLNFVSARRLLDRLIEVSLIDQELTTGHRQYRTTSRGAAYLRQVDALRALRYGTDGRA